MEGDVFSASDSAAVTATTHTEGGDDFLHHYLRLTFCYRLEAKRK